VLGTSYLSCLLDLAASCETFIGGFVYAFDLELEIVHLASRSLMHLFVAQPFSMSNLATYMLEAMNLHLLIVHLKMNDLNIRLLTSRIFVYSMVQSSLR